MDLKKRIELELRSPQKNMLETMTKMLKVETSEIELDSIQMTMENSKSARLP